ncbi:MAG: hypothetical protein EZS28_014740 [Streblomastix strix]|uniref:Uncharacterized protein n=1 Tax=Streblomastix strix TaxID=222440 RepID=A0A5J4W511_9EUKA|nr:MAG: hypothetical protein EZS28_014740 [Streblomastix strix]
MSRFFRTGTIGGCSESQQTNEDLISLPEDCLYHSLSFSSHSINDSKGNYYGYLGTGFENRENIFYNSSLYRGREQVLARRFSRHRIGII